MTFRNWPNWSWRLVLVYITEGKKRKPQKKTKCMKVDMAQTHHRYRHSENTPTYRYSYFKGSTFEGFVRAILASRISHLLCNLHSTVLCIVLLYSVYSFPLLYCILYSLILHSSTPPLPTQHSSLWKSFLGYFHTEAHRWWSWISGICG